VVDEIIGNRRSFLHMTLFSSLPRLATSTAIAALFVAAPLSTSFDLSGKLQISSAAAHAQGLEGPELGGGPPEGDPGIGGGEPPTGGGDPGTGGGEPGIGGGEPPTGGGDPGTGGGEPGIGGGDPGTVGSGTGGTGDQSVPGDGSGFPDETPTVGGTTPETEGLTPQQQGVAFAETLTCQTDCTASVSVDGDVTVTTTSTTSTGQDVETEITLVDTSVSVTVSTQGVTIPVGSGDLPTIKEAQAVVTKITASVPPATPTTVRTKLTLSVDLNSAPEISDFVTQIKMDLVRALGLPNARRSEFTFHAG
jgi:hypothetical protein